jgi:phage protein D
MPESALSELAIYTARPTIRVDEQEYPKVSELLLAMEMTEREGGMSSLELRVSNIASDTEGAADFAFEDDRILKLGAKIALYGGDVSEPREIFRGVITGLEADFREDAPPELVVLAEDIFQKARMQRRTKVHDNAVIADLASALADDLGLKPVITGFSEGIGVEAQLNESDLAFLRRLLARYDGDLQVVGDELHVAPRKDVRRGLLEMQINRQLRKARALVDLAHQVTEVMVAGWDATQGRRVSAAGRGANLGPGAGKTGANLLSGVVDKRSEHIGHLAATTDGEARSLADAAFDQRARRFVCVYGTAEGNPALRVGANVKLTGMGMRFDNTYYVVEARHCYDLARGYETHFKAECGYWGAS